MFECWKVGILKYEWRSVDGRLAVWHWDQSDTCGASADGTTLLNDRGNAKRFKVQWNAFRAAVDVIRPETKDHQ